MIDMRRLVGENVRRLRREAGLTQEQFAVRSGYTQQYLSGLERGERNPTIITVYELSQALGVSHLDLLRPPGVRKPRRLAKPRVSRLQNGD